MSQSIFLMRKTLRGFRHPWTLQVSPTRLMTPYLYPTSASQHVSSNSSHKYSRDSHLTPNHWLKVDYLEKHHGIPYCTENVKFASLALRCCFTGVQLQYDFPDLVEHTEDLPLLLPCRKCSECVRGLAAPQCPLNIVPILQISHTILQISHTILY